MGFEAGVVEGGLGSLENKAFLAELTSKFFSNFLEDIFVPFDGLIETSVVEDEEGVSTGTVANFSEVSGDGAGFICNNLPWKGSKTAGTAVAADWQPARCLAALARSRSHCLGPLCRRRRGC